MRPDDLLQEFEIDPTPIWPVEDGRLEPIFLNEPLWVEFEDLEQLEPALAPEAPLLVEYEEFEQLDPERIEAGPHVTPAAPRQPASAISLIGSLGIHLLPLLVLISWSSAPAEVSGAMPVQLVFEKPPPEEAKPEPEPGPLVPETETISEKPSAPPRRAAPASPRASPPAPPPQTKLAGVTPQPPKPTPPPKPAPAPVQPATMPLPKAAPRPPEAATPPAAAPRREATPNPAPHDEQAPGPDAPKADYFAYLVTLTQRHFDILPPAFLAGRRGETILHILVLSDGTITRIAVARSSGYPDIDARVEQMVAAVGRFPPLPQALSGPSLDVELRLFFPEALQQH